MSMCESILTIALVCTVKYLHYCDYYYTLGNDSQSTPKLIAYVGRIPKREKVESDSYHTGIGGISQCRYHYRGNTYELRQQKQLFRYLRSRKRGKACP